MKSIHKFNLITLLIISISASAQLRVGLTIAPSLTGVANFDATEREGLVHIPTFSGGSVGLPVSYDWRKGRGIQTGIYYSAINQNFVVKYKLSDESFVHRGKKRFDYIKVPLMYRKSGRIARFARSAFSFGIQYSYMIKYDGGLTVYNPNVYFDLPPTAGVTYYKKHGVDAVIMWTSELAISKKLDFVTGIKVDMSINNVAKKGLSYNNEQIFGKGLGWHPYSVGVHVGFLYVLSRADHMLLPGNTYRFRPFKRKPSQMHRKHKTK